MPPLLADKLQFCTIMDTDIFMSMRVALWDDFFLLVAQFVAEFKKAVAAGRTYERVKVEYFDDDFRRISSNALRISVNFDRVENKSLIPRRTNRLPQTLCRLTVVQEHHSRKWICAKTWTLNVFSDFTSYKCPREHERKDYGTQVTYMFWTVSK